MNMQLEYRTAESPLLSREEVIKILKESPEYFDKVETPLVEILHDGEVIHRTKKVGKVQRMFASFLEDLKKIK